MKNLKDDILGGVTAGVIALPLALAFGVSSGLGAEAGLYGAIALGFFAALMGGTATQISGPTGPMTVVSAMVVAKALESHGSIDAAATVIFGTFLLAGLIELIFGLVKVGHYVRYIPYPVVSGFMSGIGAIIIILQLNPFIGLAAKSNIVKALFSFGAALSHTNVAALALGVLTIAIIYLFPKLSKAVPSTLVALLVCTVSAYFLGYTGPIIGDIPTSLPALKWEIFSNIDLALLQTLFVPALTLAALGAIDSLLTSVVADNMTKTRHNSGRELVGQGFGNMVSALFGGLPGAGATMRTVVNINAGGKTRLSGMVHSVFLALVLLVLAPFAGQIPLAVLAGILITVGIGIVDYKGLKHVFSIPRSDAFVMLTVWGLTVFVDLLQAVFAGVVMACILFMKKMADISGEGAKVGLLEDFHQETPWSDELVPESLKDSLFVKHLYGPLFFGFTADFQSMLKAMPKVSQVIIRMERVPYIDQSGLYALESAIMDLHGRNIGVHICAATDAVRTRLENICLVPDLVNPCCLHKDFKSCLLSLDAASQTE